MATPPFSVGQLVELVNQPPNYGRSLNGTLARVVWVPQVWDSVVHAVFVELYRKHRRTGKPLAIRITNMPGEQLRPVLEPTLEQVALLAQVEPLRQEQAARREKMKADRLAWEQRILAMASSEENEFEKLDRKRMALAREGLVMLERLLIQQPPEGISSEEVVGFFQRQGASLLEVLAARLDKIANEPQPTGPF